MSSLIFAFFFIFNVFLFPLQTAEEYISNSLCVKKANASVLSNVIVSAGASRVPDDLDGNVQISADFSGNIHGNKNLVDNRSSSPEIILDKIFELPEKEANADNSKVTAAVDQDQIEIDLVAALEAIEKVEKSKKSFENGNATSVKIHTSKSILDEFPDDIDDELLITLSQTVDDQLAKAKESDTKMVSKPEKDSLKPEKLVSIDPKTSTSTKSGHVQQGKMPPTGLPHSNQQLPIFFPAGQQSYPGYPGYPQYQPFGAHPYQQYPHYQPGVPNLEAMRAMIPMYNCNNVTIHFANYNGPPPPQPQNPQFPPGN